jgi:hypothetical protein
MGRTLRNRRGGRGGTRAPSKALRTRVRNQWWNRYLFKKGRLRIAVLCANERSIQHEKWKSIIDPHFVDLAHVVYAGDASTVSIPNIRYVQWNQRLEGTFDVLVAEYCPVVVAHNQDSGLLQLLTRRILRLNGHLFLPVVQYEKLAEIYSNGDKARDTSFRRALVGDTVWYYRHRGMGAHSRDGKRTSWCSDHFAYRYVNPL